MINLPPITGAVKGKLIIPTVISTRPYHLLEAFIIKYASMCDASGKPVSFVFNEFVSTPFSNCSSYDKDPQALRQELCFRVGSADEYFQAIDQWAINYIALHSERLLKRN